MLLTFQAKLYNLNVAVVEKELIVRNQYLLHQNNYSHELQKSKKNMIPVKILKIKIHNLKKKLSNKNITTIM